MVCVRPRLGPRRVPRFSRDVAPRTRRRAKIHDLDETLVMHKRFRPILRLKELLESSTGHVLNVHSLGKLRKELNFDDQSQRLTSYAVEYPGLLKLTTDEEGWQWLEFTDEAEDIVAEKDRFVKEVHEAVCVRNVRKLLMMSRDRKLSIARLGNFKTLFHFPQDFMESVFRGYPQYYRAVQEGRRQYLELVDWDPELAVTARERKLKDNALDLDELMGDTNPHSFPMSFQRGHNITRKAGEYLEEWQKLPFPSPYEPILDILPGMQMEKRNVAVIHELLSLSVEKYARVDRLVLFRKEFKTTMRVHNLVERFPGIFYTSHKEDRITVFLKEAYSGMRLIDRSPLLDFRDRFIQLCLMRPSGRYGEPPRSYARPLTPVKLKKEVDAIQRDLPFQHPHMKRTGRIVGLGGRQVRYLKKSVCKNRNPLKRAGPDVFEQQQKTVQSLRELEKSFDKVEPGTEARP